jgi:isochorismate synthase
LATQSVVFDVRGLRTAIGGWVSSALADLAGQHVVGVITVPAPFAPLSAFLDVVPRDMSFVWNNPPSGTDCAGGGVAHRIEVTGRDRLSQLRAQSDALWARVRTVTHPAAPRYAPRLVGGMAFAPHNSERSPWVDFGDGAFSLARWTYGRMGPDGFLSLAVRCDEDAGASWRSRLLEELDSILEALFTHEGRPTPVPSLEAAARPPVRVSQFPVQDWEVHIGKIHDAIASGRFLKIVAARRCDVTLSDAPSDVDVLNRLMTEPKCTHFAFRRAQSTFVGASPELLFLKSGLDLRTQALAGTARSSGPRAAAHSGQSERLLGSLKDRSEHDFVVAAIRDSLTPLCTAVSVATDPEVLDLRNIMHINTPFQAKVRPTTHVTELLGTLHPTPAVGGVPGHAAREWIVENEREERGWYTGPVGWFDSDGDAEFAVAIRCGVISGTQAHLYTGAGVVLNSDHTAEYAETALKQLPMLRALGVPRAPEQKRTPRSRPACDPHVQPL